MPSQRCSSRLAARRLGILLALFSVLASCTAPGARGVGGTPTRGALSVAFDNDSFNRFRDGNYSNGIALTWQSPEVRAYAEDSLVRRATETVADLFGTEEDRRHLTLAAGHLIFTAENLRIANPPEGAHPYAGILFVDTGLHVRDAGDAQGWTSVSLRLGVTGDASFAEDVQTELHSWFGSDDPQGWDTQLQDEGIVNLGIERTRRFPLHEHVDWTASLAGAVGTYFTGAVARTELRFGELRADLGSSSMRLGLPTVPYVDDAPLSGWAGHAFLAAEGSGIAHFLPIDGGVVRSGRSAEREPWVGAASVGLQVAHGSALLRAGFTWMSDTYEAQFNDGEFGSISLTWFH